MSTDPFEYDVALSFASQDRSAAERLSGLLAGRNISVLLDEYKPDVPWGGDVLYIYYILNMLHISQNH